jgi:hypothetical protein
MANNTRGVTFQLKLDSSGLKSGAGEAKAAFDDLASKATADADKITASVDKTTKSVEDLAKSSDKTAAAGERFGLVIGAAITAATAAYLDLTSKAISGLDDLYVTSQKLGTSTEYLSTLKVAAQQNGVAWDQLGGSLNTFSSNLAKAAGGSKVQAQLFQQMGVSVTDASGHIKSLDTILGDTADAFATYKDGPDKAALANRLFGASGAELIPLLNDLGDKGFAKVREEAEKLGLVVDGQTAKAAHSFNDQLTALKLTTESYFNRVAADVLPNLIEFAKGLNDVAGKANDVNDKTTILGDGIRGIATWFVEAYAEVQRFGVGIASTFDTIGVELAKAKTQLTDPGYLDALGRALSGDAYAQAAVKAANANLDKQFQGKLDAIRSAADQTFADIDKTVADRVHSINRNISSIGEGAPEKIRSGAAPFAELGRGSGSGSDNTAALENSLQSFERYADSLSEKVGGPLQQAFQKYSDTINAVDQRAEKLVIDGANVTRVISAQNVAYANATNALKQHIAQIVLAKEKNDAWVISQQKLQDIAGDYEKQLGDEIDATEARIAAGGELNDMEEAEIFIKKNLTDASGNVKKGYEAEADSIRKMAAELQKLHAEEKLGEDFTQLFNTAAQSVRNGEDAFKSLGDAAIPVLQDIGKQIIKIIDANDEAVSGLSDFQAGMQGIQKSVVAALPAIGQFVGLAAGGGGQNAAIGAQAGSVIGGIIGSFFYGNYAAGAAIGGVLGGLIGGAFDHQRTYEARVSGAGRPDEQSIEGPFGTINAGQAGDNQDPNLVGKIRDFDKIIAGILPPELVDDVTARIQAFNGSFASIDDLLAARFNAVLDALDPVISDFVRGFSSDLQTEIQALADIFNLQKLENAGRLITDNLSDALDLIAKFGLSGERVAETYSRLVTSTVDYQQALQLMGVAFDGTKTQLVEFAQGISDAVGTTQEADALWQQFFKDFYSQAEITAGNINLLQGRANDSLTKIGLDSTVSMEDFRKKFESALPTLTPEQVAQWLQAGVALGALNDAINALIDQGEALVDKLYGGGTLESVNQQIAALQGQTDNASDSVQHFGHAMTSVADAAKAAADLLLGDLSPLNDQQKLQYAIQGLRNGTVSQEQVLQIGRNLYASSQAYTDLFNMVTRMGGTGGSSSDYFNSGASSGHSSVLSAEDQHRLDDLIARRDELEARERRNDANQLATTVAQLALTQKESFEDVAKELGFNLDDLANDLGLTSDDLNTYLKNIQAQQTAVPDSITSNTDRQIKAMYDIAGKQVPPWAIGTPDDSGVPDNTSPHRAGYVVGRGGHSGHAAPPRPIVDRGDEMGIAPAKSVAVNTAATNDALATANRTLNLILTAVRDGASATRDVVTETRGMHAAMRTPTGRRNTRVPE